MQDYQKLLKLLVDNDVQFVIIGGFAAVVHGSSIMTEDLDLCISFEKDNIECLLNAFRDIHPQHRLIGRSRPLIESAEKLAKLKNLYLKTDCGYIDILSEVSEIGNFKEVYRNSVEIPLFGMKCRVLDIDALIRSKGVMKRSKDKETIVQLRAVKEKRKK